MKNFSKFAIMASLLFSVLAVSARTETVKDVGKSKILSIENPAQITTNFVAEVKTFEYISTEVDHVQPQVAIDQIVVTLPSFVRTSIPMWIDERIRSTEDVLYQEVSKEKKPPTYRKRE